LGKSGKETNVVMTEYRKNVENTESPKISKLLEISTGSIVSVVGCGGKTSLIELIAKENKEKKVLISPTTKTFPIICDEVISCNSLNSSIKHKPQTGIQCLGQLNNINGKLEALPDKVLAELTPLYDIVLMEADGSRELPCKGWLENEPVIPPYSTHTVGVVTMDAVGKAATAYVVHHLAEFLSLTTLLEGDIITKQSLEDMVCLPKGMFDKAVGHKFIIVNKVEYEAIAERAVSFLECIKVKYPNTFKRLIYGSVLENIWKTV